MKCYKSINLTRLANNNTIPSIVQIHENYILLNMHINQQKCDFRNTYVLDINNEILQKSYESECLFFKLPYLNMFLPNQCKETISILYFYNKYIIDSNTYNNDSLLQVCKNTIECENTIIKLLQWINPTHTFESKFYCGDNIFGVIYKNKELCIIEYINKNINVRDISYYPVIDNFSVSQCGKYLIVISNNNVDILTIENNKKRSIPFDTLVQHNTSIVHATILTIDNKNMLVLLEHKDNSFYLCIYDCL